MSSNNNNESDNNNHQKNASETSSSDGESSSDKVIMIRTGLCGPRKQVKSGRDFGVWDKSLEDQANCLSDWSLSYLNPILALGSRKVLDADDIGVPSQQDKADRAYQVALSAWEEQAAKARTHNAVFKQAYEKKLEACTNETQREKIEEPKYKEPSIAVSLVKGFGGWKIFLAMVYQVISALLAFVPVMILNNLVRFFESGEPIDEYDGIHPWAQVAALGVLPIIISILNTRHSVIMAHAAVFVRTAVSTLLYRKALRVSAAGRAVTSTGQVVNMMSNDTAQLQRFLQFIGFTMTAPLQIVIALYFIYQEVGNATWVGVGFMVFLAPINTVVFSIVSKQRRLVLKYSDMRVKMMNEILAGIRIIKFYAWERPFGKEVGDLRGKELEALTKLAYTSAIGFSLILLSAPLIQPILVFLTYVNIQDAPLKSSTAFTTVALFNIMRFPFAFLPMGLLQFIQSRISLKRLERYLDLPELPEYVEKTGPPSDPDAKHGSIIVKQGTFSWVDPDAKPVRPVQDVKPERTRASRRGSRRSQGSSAGAEAELQNSVRSNTSRLSNGSTKTPTITLQDLTFTIPSGSLVAVVGPVGSGKSSFLSALLGEMEPMNDSKVYIPRPENAPLGYISYCTQSPWVVNDTLRGNVLFGRPFDQERYDQVVEACALADDMAVLPAGDMTEIGERGINLSGGQKARVSLARALYSNETQLMLMDDPLSAVDAHVGEHIFGNAIAGPLAQDMTRVLVTHHVHLLSRCDSVIVLEKGRIKHHGPYRQLVANGVDFAGAVDVSRATGGGETKEKEEEAPKERKPEEITAAKKDDLQKKGKKLVKDEERNMGSVDGSAYWHYAKAGGYCVAASAIIIQALGRASEITSGFFLALWAERSFEAAQDGEPFTLVQTNRYLGGYAAFGMVGVLGLTLRAIVIAVHRLRASKLLHDDLTERVLRAPVAFFDVTPTGRILNRFAADMDKIDLELTQSLSQGISTVFSVLGAVGAIVVATNGTFLGPLLPLGYIYYVIQKWFRKTSTELQRVNSIANSPIFADFSQTLSGTSTIRAYGGEERIEMTNYLKHGVRMLATIEAQMNSVERVLFYSNNIDTEADDVKPDTDPNPNEWPSNGNIDINDISMRYRDGPVVLKGISVHIKGGEKVGVCGRTGSGKSSLMVALFRIAELENDGGGIIIDGVNTSDIGTTTLRLNLSIIPQDPVIFSNTVRYNLDPFGTSSDEELWEVLRKVQMEEVIADLEGGLQYEVAEGGENFSQGQRQLLCIARALLRKPKILVMDEATASIDNTTDATIQTMIRENFKDATVLTIAHRLNTIMDSDRVLVLNDGHVAEYDSPQALLKKPDGLFRAMVEKSQEAQAHGKDQVSH
eukprot:scaffold108_cov162-Amphora_coffeaeformis.AAC.4